MMNFGRTLGFQKVKTCFFTGHRDLPDRQGFIFNEIFIEVCNLSGQGATDFICGGERGIDTLAARAVLELREHDENVRLRLYLPCRDRAWNREILEAADEVRYFAKAYNKGCRMRCMRAMVEDSDVCAYYMKHYHGGTFRTVWYAGESGILLTDMGNRPNGLRYSLC